VKIFIYKSRFAISVEELFQFHENPEGFTVLIGKEMEIIQRPRSIQTGEIAILKVPILPGIRVRWKALHTAYVKNELFCDEMVEGPFRTFRHCHLFYPYNGNKNESVLEDRIEYEAAFAPISDHVVPFFLIPQFQKRHRLTAEHLKCDYEPLLCTVTSNLV